MSIYPWLNQDSECDYYLVGTGETQVVIEICDIMKDHNVISFNIWELDGTLYNGGELTPLSSWYHGEDAAPTTKDIVTEVCKDTLIDINYIKEINF